MVGPIVNWCQHYLIWHWYQEPYHLVVSSFRRHRHRRTALSPLPLHCVRRTETVKQSNPGRHSFDMKITGRFDSVLLVALGGSVAVDGFSVRPETAKTVTTVPKVPWKDVIGKAVCSSLVAASIWSAPSLPFAPIEMRNVAVAKEMASGSGSRVNKDADSLLRYGLPIKNKEVRIIALGHLA